jgi:Transposase DDE domain/Domain of unknown function (DUF4372)
MVPSSSLFAQVLKLVDRSDFERAVREYEAEKHAKGFSCWDQFVSMLFCQMGGAHSLGEICGGLKTALGKLSHLGLSEAPAKSTLAYANSVRPWDVYQRVFEQTLQECQSLAATKQRKFRFKNPLYSLDSSTIDLCLSVFDWAKYRRTKGAIKLHLMLDHQGYLPCWGLVTDGSVHDVKVAQKLDFPVGSIVVMDRGYVDFNLLARWTFQGVGWVTRAKGNLAYEPVKSMSVPEKGKVLKDELIRLTTFRSQEAYPKEIRRVVMWDEDQQRELVFLTNQLGFAASTVAFIYKERWQIELFFKALKQNLKVKTFVGTTENAVQTQIWTALIAMLLLKFLQLKSRIAWSLSHLAAMLRMNLLTYRDLWAWLDAPYKVPRLEAAETQMELIPI